MGFRVAGDVGLADQSRSSVKQQGLGTVGNGCAENALFSCFFVVVVFVCGGQERVIDTLR